MKRPNLILLVLLQLFFTLPIGAQESVKKVFDMIRPNALPYAAAKGVVRVQSVGMPNPGNILPDTLYTDFQHTQYLLVNDDSELSPAIFAKFPLPNSNFMLGAVSFGGATDYDMTYLIVVDQQGNIKDVLSAEIMLGFVPSKQFRISKEGIITVTSLQPTSSKSVSMDDFTSINACRVD